VERTFAAVVAGIVVGIGEDKLVRLAESLAWVDWFVEACCTIVAADAAVELASARDWPIQAATGCRRKRCGG